MELKPLAQERSQWHRPHQPASALDGEGIFFYRFGRCGGVDAEALMNPQRCIAAQIENCNKVLSPQFQGAGLHTAELRRAPGPINLAMKFVLPYKKILLLF